MSGAILVFVLSLTDSSVRLSLAEALARLERDFAPARRLVDSSEQVPLAEALGRVLAEPVLAGRAVPPTDNAAVDGWAFCRDGAEGKAQGKTQTAAQGETQGEMQGETQGAVRDKAQSNAQRETSGARISLQVIGRAAAGHPFDGVVKSGQAVRIFTGAALPQGADTVAPEEVCEVGGDLVAVPADLQAGSNARKAGEDLTQGQEALPVGRRLRPQDVGLAAACGLGRVAVRRRLSVAVFSSGDELIDPPQEPDAAGVWDSNRAMVCALLSALGCVVEDGGILPDARQATESALARAAESHDLVLASGGMSAGEEDHLRLAAESLGELSFWRLAIKPGRPIALGQICQTPFAGLPGNPVAAFVTFVVFVRPLILRLTGAIPEPPIGVPVAAGFSMAKKTGRREWVRVSLCTDAAGRVYCEKFPRSGAGILSSLTETSGLLELAEDLDRVEAGAFYPFLSFPSLIY